MELATVGVTLKTVAVLLPVANVDAPDREPEVTLVTAEAVEED